jgi:stage V sporulation protein SpoVS
MERVETLSIQSDSDEEPDGTKRYAVHNTTKPTADYLTSKTNETSNYIIVETQLPGKIADALLASLTAESRMLPVIQLHSDAAANRAVKALSCISETLERSDKDIYALVDFTAWNNEVLRTCNIYTWTTSQREDYSSEPSVSVAKTSIPQRTGSYIARVFKENKRLQNMRISACGEICVGIALQSIFFARHYLSTEASLDLTMTPRFGRDGELTVINMYVTCFSLNRSKN